MVLYRSDEPLQTGAKDSKKRDASASRATQPADSNDRVLKERKALMENLK